VKPVNASLLFDSLGRSLGVSTDDQVLEFQARPVRSLEPLRGGRILLVEDNEINQEVALGLLEDAPVRVDVANNGAIALEKVRSGDYDLVFMDMQMPVMDGLTATREIRKIKGLEDLPILAMTANAMAGDRERCIEAGMNDHVAKPIDPDDLFDKLLHWLKPKSTGAPPMLSEEQLPLAETGPPSASRVSQAPAPDANGAAAPPSATLSAAGVDDILDLPGIDVESALKRVGGRRALYLTLLKRLAEEQSGIIESIRAWMDAGDIETAARAAHSLKGSAGMLGAVELSAAAANVETSIKNKNGVESSLQALRPVLETVLDGIRSLA
jgi:two-component system sensor histidine kinase/response regulator